MRTESQFSGQQDPIRRVVSRGGIEINVSMTHKCTKCGYVMHDSDGALVEQLPFSAQRQFNFDANYNLQGCDPAADALHSSRRATIIGKDISRDITGRMNESLNWSHESRAIDRDHSQVFQDAKLAFLEDADNWIQHNDLVFGDNSWSGLSAAERKELAQHRQTYLEQRKQVVLRMANFDDEKLSLLEAYRSFVSVSADQLQDAFAKAEDRNKIRIAMCKLPSDRKIYVHLCGDGNYTLPKKVCALQILVCTHHFLIPLID